MSAAHKQAEEREVGMRHFAARQVDEVREYVPLQVVDLDEGYVACDGETFGEGCADQKRSQKTRSAREGYGVELVDRDAGLLEGGVDDGDDVLLVRARCQLGNYSSVLDVYGLRGDDVRQQRGVAYDGGRGVVA